MRGRGVILALLVASWTMTGCRSTRPPGEGWITIDEDGDGRTDVWRAPDGSAEVRAPEPGSDPSRTVVLAIDAIPLLFPPRLRRITRRGTSLLAAALCIKLADGAYAYLNQERQFGGTEILGIASWQAQSILLLGLAALAYRFIVAAIEGADQDPHAPEAETPLPSGDDSSHRPAVPAPDPTTP